MFAKAFLLFRDLRFDLRFAHHWYDVGMCGGGGGGFGHITQRSATVGAAHAGAVAAMMPLVRPPFVQSVSDYRHRLADRRNYRRRNCAI